jgi:hypothetical protein
LNFAKLGYRVREQTDSTLGKTPNPVATGWAFSFEGRYAKGGVLCGKFLKICAPRMGKTLQSTP